MNNKRMQVSIILPVYNGGRFIGQAIESVIKQDDVDKELIIIDDGSTDNTELEIKKYCNYSWIKCYKQKNLGVCAARNKGLEVVSKDFVIFMDADDWLSEKSLKNRIKRAENSDLQISNYYNWRDDGMEKPEYEISKDGSISVNQALWSLSSASEIGYQGYLWNKVFKNEIIKRNKLRFNEELSYGEDRLFLCKYLLSAKSVNVSKERVYFYRQNNGVMSGFANVSVSNWRRINTEFVGLDNILRLVKEYDKKLFYVFLDYKFYLALVLFKLTPKEIKAFRQCLNYYMKESLKELLLANSECVSSKKKIKTVIHYLLKK